MGRGGASSGTEFFRRASGLRMWGALSWGKLSGGVFSEYGASCHLKVGRHVLWLFRLSNFVVDKCVCFAFSRSRRVAKIQKPKKSQADRLTQNLNKFTVC